jgi:hypothetical protein
MTEQNENCCAYAEGSAQQDLPLVPAYSEENVIQIDAGLGRMLLGLGHWYELIVGG